jgi:hypothetical protein
MTASSLITDYIGCGLAAARPATPSLATGAFGIYYATDTGALSIWNGSSWSPLSGSGTVTSVTASSPLTGGAITSSGSIGLPTSLSGAASYTAHGVLLGNGASALNATAAGTAGQKLVSGGASADPAWQSYRGALVTKASNQTTANYSAGVYMAFDSESYDTDAIHDNVTNNTRLTVPTGVTKVRVQAALWLSLVTGGTACFFQIQKNGVNTYLGAPLTVFANATSADVGLSSATPVLTVTAGDYFEVLLLCSDTSITVNANSTWFAMEIIE